MTPGNKIYKSRCTYAILKRNTLVYSNLGSAKYFLFQWGLYKVLKFQIHTVFPLKNAVVFFTKLNINEAFIRKWRSLEYNDFDKFLAKSRRLRECYTVEGGVYMKVAIFRERRL